MLVWSHAMSRIPAVLAATFLLAAPAWAQDEDDEPIDFDEPASKTSRKASGRAQREQVVREIERGFYVKGNVGTTIYFGPRGNLLQPGTTLDLVVGQDFIDKPKLSVAWELSFYQAIHNARYGTYEEMGYAAGYDPNVLLQGDTHVFGIMGGFEASAYPVRRVGIGGHLGGGVGFAPLLMAEPFYSEDVVGEWGGAASRPAVHDGVLGMVYAGPTVEYYTKLSHFSLGLDVDFLYVIGLDFGMTATGFFKYTF